jgi:hypothetical protein
LVGRSAPVSRVLFPVWAAIIPLGRTIARRLKQPYPRDCERAAHPPIWPCSGWGLACARGHPRAGGLLPRLFTLTLAGGIFSVPLSADRSAPPLTATLPCGARTFLPAEAERSPGALTASTIIAYCAPRRFRIGAEPQRKRPWPISRRRNREYAGSSGRSESEGASGFRCRAVAAAAAYIPGRCPPWPTRPRLLAGARRSYRSAAAGPG